jgi:hypothetical protein
MRTAQILDRNQAAIVRREYSIVICAIQEIGDERTGFSPIAPFNAGKTVCDLDLAAEMHGLGEPRIIYVRQDMNPQI